MFMSTFHESMCQDSPTCICFWYSAFMVMYTFHPNIQVVPHVYVSGILHVNISARQSDYSPTCSASWQFYGSTQALIAYQVSCSATRVFSIIILFIAFRTMCHCSIHKTMQQFHWSTYALSVFCSATHAFNIIMIYFHVSLQHTQDNETISLKHMSTECVLLSNTCIQHHNLVYCIQNHASWTQFNNFIEAHKPWVWCSATYAFSICNTIQQPTSSNSYLRSLELCDIFICILSMSHLWATERECVYIYKHTVIKIKQCNRTVVTTHDHSGVYIYVYTWIYIYIGWLTTVYLHKEQQ